MALIGSLVSRVTHKSDISPSVFPPDLKNGDVWQQTENGLVIKNWQWLGDRWIGDYCQSNLVATNLGSTTFNSLFSVDLHANLQLKQLEISYLITGVNDATRYRIFRLYRVSNTATVLIAQANTIGANARQNLIVPINLDDNLTLNQTLYYRLEIARVGSPGVINATARLVYRHWINY